MGCDVEATALEGWCELMRACWADDAKQRPAFKRVLDALSSMHDAPQGHAMPEGDTMSYTVQVRRSIGPEGSPVKVQSEGTSRQTLNSTFDAVSLSVSLDTLQLASRTLNASESPQPQRSKQEVGYDGERDRNIIVRI